MSGSVWDDVVGQERAIEQLHRAAVDPVHAYLLVGPHGSTVERAARAFASVLLTGSDDAESRDARLVLAGEHPDCREVERVGAAIDRDQAEWIVEQAWLSPVEGSSKVMLLHEFHLLSEIAAGRMLKTVEEPPESTRFVIVAESVPTSLVTIASRCVRVDFATIPGSVIASRLVTEGVDPAVAEVVSAGASGDLERARVLANDPEVAERRAAFASVFESLDGSGRAAIEFVDRVELLIDRAAEPLKARHAAEAAELQERIERVGARGSGRKQLEDRHKRELRRFTTDELRTGLATMAGAYRDAAVTARIATAEASRAVSAIQSTISSLGRNANSTLALQRLVWSLPLP